ncbi:MAG: aminoglycoside 3'-phosphotransferase [Peptostreptococcaceae bacterium]
MKNSMCKNRMLNIIDRDNVPQEIQKYIEGNAIQNRTFSNKSKVFYIEDKNVYIKVGTDLEEEKINTIYFNKKGIAGEVLDFARDDNYDYLVIKEINGDNGIENKYLNNPKKLAESFGEHLRMIHSIDKKDCPEKYIIERLIEGAKENVATNNLNMQSFFNKNGFTPQKGLLILEDLKNCYVNDTFIHGDYCLPNIIMDNYNFKGIVDLDSCGIGDRHYDLCCGLWSLRYNLKTSEFGEIFLGSYGYDVIDKDRLLFCKLLFILN